MKNIIYFADEEIRHEEKRFFLLKASKPLKIDEKILKSQQWYPCYVKTKDLNLEIKKFRNKAKRKGMSFKLEKNKNAIRRKHYEEIR